MRGSKYMFKSNSRKKIKKKFNNFTEEEQWLQSMLNDGWLLISYDSEEVGPCQYVFESLQHTDQKKLIYKIDFRNFNKKEDFQEFKNIFEDAGWTMLSKSKWYSKHICYTENQNTDIDIFSDIESYGAREKQKMSVLLCYILTCFVGCIALSFLYNIYNRSSFLAVGLLSFVTGVKVTLDYFKHKKIYKSLTEK
ncbi:hypothetical protein CO726_13230 [Bacillus fungorum]|uniref:DUF2812 domain-containing protein n=2 Tax=Bacillus fungorum TaxID=2039284 RepID=A0A2G6QE01_9BACI|nr:hypothetical protein CO726_13230 [Bacillus fungorum]